MRFELNQDTKLVHFSFFFWVDVAPRQTAAAAAAWCDIVGVEGKACREQPTSLCSFSIVGEMQLEYHLHTERNIRLWILRLPQLLHPAACEAPWG